MERKHQITQVCESSRINVKVRYESGGVVTTRCGWVFHFKNRDLLKTLSVDIRGLFHVHQTFSSSKTICTHKTICVQVDQQTERPTKTLQDQDAEQSERSPWNAGEAPEGRCSSRNCSTKRTRLHVWRSRRHPGRCFVDGPEQKTFGDGKCPDIRTTSKESRRKMREHQHVNLKGTGVVLQEKVMQFYQRTAGGRIGPESSRNEEDAAKETPR